MPAPRRMLGWLARGLGIALLLALFWQAVLLTQVVWWSRFDPGSTSFMRIRLAELRKSDPQAELRHQWVPYERISIHLKRAVVAAEDDRFLDHAGFDWEGIERALERNAERGRMGQWRIRRRSRRPPLPRPPRRQPGPGRGRAPGGDAAQPAALREVLRPPPGRARGAGAAADGQFAGAVSVRREV